MKVIILAAGYATRLYPLTLDTPKCLLSVGGQSILDALCHKISALGEVDEVIVITNAKFYGKLKSWKKKAPLRVPVRILNDGTLSNETRLGAIGDLSFAIKECGIHDDILMLASDNLFEEDLQGFLEFSIKNKGAVSVALHDIRDPKLAANRYGVLEVNAEKEVVSIEEKPAHPKSSLIGMGVYYFPKSTLEWVREYLKDKEAKDAPGHYIRWLVGRVKIFGFTFSGMWYDIGDLAALEEANKILS